jgi:hypothetical protein
MKGKGYGTECHKPTITVNQGAVVEGILKALEMSTNLCIVSTCTSLDGVSYIGIPMKFSFIQKVLCDLMTMVRSISVGNSVNSNGLWKCVY